MEENMTFTLLTDDGEEILCEVIFTYEDPNTGNNYIAFTPGDLDQDGLNDVFVYRYDPEDEESPLNPIESEEEWAMVQGLLEDMLGQDAFEVNR